MFDLKTRVLVVDDFLNMRKTVVKICEQIGFTQVVEATDGQEAWKLMDTANPPIGLLISDITMPNMNGIELLTQVRKDPRYKKVPVLMVTAEGENQSIVAAVKAGASNYLIKPFEAPQMIEKLELMQKKLGG